MRLTTKGPTTPYASVEHGNFKYVGYTGVFNVVDYSAVSFPCGVIADKEKDQVPTNYTPLSDICKEAHGDCKSKDALFVTSQLTCPDNAGIVHGMPVSLQLISKRLEEEKVLSMTETVLQAVYP